ncbi:MAG TPA: hypothetical protein VMT51_14935, partial [Dongiaceae bacterium]|nr:hypothetical protein [Dongiaceae bacterium]
MNLSTAWTIKRLKSSSCVIALAVGVLLVAHASFAEEKPAPEPLRFRSAIDLALQHSGVMAIATA